MSQCVHIKAFRAQVSLWALTLASITALQLPTPLAYADEVNEFDTGAEGWAISPTEIGRTSDPGWVVVANDGEQAIKANPTPTDATYYWKLTKDFDLTHINEPSLEVKFHFKGGGYEYFQITAGEESARRLSDFSVLHEQRIATAAPETVRLDLSAYAGRITRIQLLLKKPSGVVERTTGVYIHRVGVQSPPAPVDLEERPGELRVAAFNIQVFGRTKAAKPEVLSALVNIMTRFDAVLVQEVRDSTGEAVLTLLNALNAAAAPNTYAMIQSPRLGRTISKEQYAFFYRTDLISLISEEVLADPQDLFEREPYMIIAEEISSGLRFRLLAAHLDPDAAGPELAEMYARYNALRASAPASEPWVLMGDFNADCEYLRDAARAAHPYFTSALLSQLIMDADDTTTTTTHCAYDRVGVSDFLMSRVLEWGVFNFEQELALTGDLTRAVSDHFPVWLRFSLGL
jgi:endonuclease/exonuclease/phosphatase family metal-dependent hydrolase